MPAPYAQEFTPDVVSRAVQAQLSGIDLEGEQEEGQADSAAASRGLLDQAQGASMAAGAEADTASKRASAISNWNYKVAGMQTQERMTEEQQAYESSEAQKDRDAQQQMQQAYETYMGQQNANIMRAKKIAGEQGEVVGGIQGLAEAGLMAALI